MYWIIVNVKFAPTLTTPTSRYEYFLVPSTLSYTEFISNYLPSFKIIPKRIGNKKIQEEKEHLQIEKYTLHDLILLYEKEEEPNIVQGGSSKKEERCVAGEFVENCPYPHLHFSELQNQPHLI